MIDRGGALAYTGVTCQGINGRFYLPANSRYSMNARIPWQGLGKRRIAAFCVSEVAVKEIPLTQGKVALVDDGDYDWLMQWKWCAVKCRGPWYAKRLIHTPERQWVIMHRLIIEAAPGQFVDHADRNGLNNQRSNLRICTIAQNAANRAKRPGLFKYKGVSQVKSKWVATIRIDGKNSCIGRFDNEVDAARAYDIAAKEKNGVFAVLNFKEVQDEI